MLDDKDEFSPANIVINLPPEVLVRIYRDNVWGFLDGAYRDEATMKHYGATPPFTKAKGMRMAGRYLIMAANIIDGDLRRVTHA